MRIIGLKGGGSYVMTKYITSPADGVVAKLIYILVKKS